MKQEMKREAWIDIAKGLAIIFVVIGHVVTSYRNSGLLLQEAAFNFVCDFVYIFHMPLFFFLSGLLGGKRKQTSLRNTIIQKCVVYGIPYVLFSVIAVGLKICAASLVNSKLDLTDLFGIALYPISSLWFLYALLIISVVQSVLRTCFARYDERRVCLVFLIIAFILKQTVQAVGQMDTAAVKQFSQSIVFDAANYWFWYALGEYSVELVSAAKKHAERLHWGAPLLFAVAFVCATYLIRAYEIEFFLLNELLAAAGIVLTAAYSMKLSRSSRLEELGRLTMPVYLMHGYVISAARILLQKLHIPLLHGATPLLVCTVLAIVLPLAVYTISCRIGGLDFFFYPGRYLLKKRSK